MVCISRFIRFRSGELGRFEEVGRPDQRHLLKAPASGGAGRRNFINYKLEEPWHD